MSLYQYPTEAGGTPVLFGNYHGVMVPDPWDMPIQSFQVPGLSGVGHLIDTIKSRHLSCYLRYQGFDTYALLETGLANLDAQNGQLVGNVYFSGGALNGATFPKCTFMGYERTSEIKYDGSGQNGWWIEGRLHWIQRSQ